MTIRALRVHQGLQSDLAEALDYYGDIDERLRSRFARAYVDGLRTIRERPLSLREYRPGFRRIVLVLFPYLLALIVDDRSIHVAALLHARRDPHANESVLATPS